MRDPPRPPPPPVSAPVTISVLLDMFVVPCTIFTYRMLRSLLSAHGVNPKMITVFIDGYFEVSGRLSFFEPPSKSG